MAGEKIVNSGYGYACRIDNIKEANKGNAVISGCVVSEQATPAMAVDIASGTIRAGGGYTDVPSTSKNIDASDATYDRYDIICVGSDGTVDYVVGTAQANPYPPDLPDDHILLAIIFVEHGSTTIVNANIDDNRIIDERPFVPIGGIIAWAKSLTGMPSIPYGFVECNGQTLNDGESPLNGQVIPDLNGSSGAQRFLRGSTTSGTVGGEDTHTLTIDEMPSHTHTVQRGGDQANGSYEGTSSIQNGTVTSGATGGGSPHNNLPSYYEVVWIMRVK